MCLSLRARLDAANAPPSCLDSVSPTYDDFVVVVDDDDVVVCLFVCLLYTAVV
jgi:hypothetical protein